MSALSIQLLCCVTPETGFLDLQLASCPPSGVNKMGLFEGGKTKYSWLDGLVHAAWMWTMSNVVQLAWCGGFLQW